MIRRLAKGGFAAVLLSLGLLAAAPQAAQAGNPNFGIHLKGQHGSVYIGSGHHYGKRHHRPGYGKRICSPGEAAHKARRMGIRHAHVDRVGKRLIVVEGYKRGHRVKAGFERRSRHCEVAFIKRDRPHYRGYGYGYGRGHNSHWR